jgi:preprotein translocase subunit SecG
LRTTPARFSHPVGLLLGIAVGLVVVAVVAIVVLVPVLFPGGGAHALQAAGLTQDSNSAISGIETFADRLTDNVKWLVATLIGLALAVVGLLFAMGHTRAHDIAIKAGIGVAIIVGLGGIVK